MSSFSILLTSDQIEFDIERFKLKEFRYCRLNPWQQIRKEVREHASNQVLSKTPNSTEKCVLKQVVPKPISTQRSGNMRKNSKLY